MGLTTWRENLPRTLPLPETINGQPTSPLWAAHKFFLIHAHFEKNQNLNLWLTFKNLILPKNSDFYLILKNHI